MQRDWLDGFLVSIFLFIVGIENLVNSENYPLEPNPLPSVFPNLLAPQVTDVSLVA